MDRVFSLILLIALASPAAAQNSTTIDLSAQDKATLHPYQLRISQKVAEALLLHRVEPDYPAAIKASGISGQIVIRFVIDRQGHPTGVLPSRDESVPSIDNRELIEAAIKAVREWRFKPYVLNGHPVEVETRVIMPFSFAGQTPSPSPTPDSAKADKRFRIAQGVAEGNVVHKVPPQYPEKAKERHIIGDVILGFTIDRNGNVVDLKVLEGDPLLAEAATKAVSQWKYKPYLLNGEPVEVDTTAKISFRM